MASAGRVPCCQEDTAPPPPIASPALSPTVTLEHISQDPLVDSESLEEPGITFTAAKGLDTHQEKQASRKPRREGFPYGGRAGRRALPPKTKCRSAVSTELREVTNKLPWVEIHAQMKFQNPFLPGGGTAPQQRRGCVDSAPLQPPRFPGEHLAGRGRWLPVQTCAGDRPPSPDRAGLGG